MGEVKAEWIWRYLENELPVAEDRESNDLYVEGVISPERMAAFLNRKLAEEEA
jgi:hypothetical protein